MEPENMENWKQFQGTELGGLMSQLYGSKPIIEYPKPKSSKAFAPKEKYNSYRSTSSTDISNIRKIVKVNVPKLSGKPVAKDVQEITPQCLVDIIPHRRPQEVIQKEIDTIKMKQTHYRPAHTKPISSDQEKEKLSQIFEYKGGKILPSELTNRVSDAPFEILERNKEKSRIEAIKIKRGLVKTSSPSALSITEQQAEQLTSEIEERRKYLSDMKELGALSKHEEARILAEIQTRIKSYSKIE